MRLTLKLFATLGQYLPPGAERNKAQIEVAEGTTVSQLVTELGLPLELTHLVLINGVYVSPEDRDERTFQTGDEFAVFPPIAGGAVFPRSGAAIGQSSTGPSQG